MAYDDVIQPMMILYVKEIKLSDNGNDEIHVHLGIVQETTEEGYVLKGGTSIDKKLVYKILPDTQVNDYFSMIEYYKAKNCLT